jgi:hypothetical protein
LEDKLPSEIENFDELRILVDAKLVPLGLHDVNVFRPLSRIQNRLINGWNLDPSYAWISKAPGLNLTQTYSAMEKKRP